MTIRALLAVFVMGLVSHFYALNSFAADLSAAACIAEMQADVDAYQVSADAIVSESTLELQSLLAAGNARGSNETFAGAQRSIVGEAARTVGNMQTLASRCLRRLGAQRAAAADIQGVRDAFMQAISDVGAIQSDAIGQLESINMGDAGDPPPAAVELARVYTQTMQDRAASFESTSQSYVDRAVAMIESRVASGDIETATRFARLSQRVLARSAAASHQHVERLWEGGTRRLASWRNTDQLAAGLQSTRETALQQIDFAETDGNLLIEEALTGVSPAPPVDDAATVSNANSPLELDVLANDPPGSMLRTFTQPAGGGIVTRSGDLLEYDPNGTSASTDTFTYSTRGGTATVTITIVQPPVDDAATTIDNTTPVDVPVLDNDPLGSTLESFSQGTIGSVTRTGDTLTYDPGGTTATSDSFTYTTPAGTATVSITIRPANNPPTATDDVVTPSITGTIEIMVLGNDTDPDGDPIQITDITSSQSAQIDASVDGDRITFTAPEPFDTDVTFDYTIVDDRGGSDTGTVTVRAPARGEVSLQNSLTVDATFTIASGQLVDCTTGAPLTSIVVPAGTTLIVCVEIGPSGTTTQNIDFSVNDGTNTFQDRFEIQTTQRQRLVISSTGLTSNGFQSTGSTGTTGTVVRIPRIRIIRF